MALWSGRSQQRRISFGSLSRSCPALRAGARCQEEADHPVSFPKQNTNDFLLRCCVCQANRDRQDSQRLSGPWSGLLCGQFPYVLRPTTWPCRLGIVQSQSTAFELSTSSEIVRICSSPFPRLPFYRVRSGNVRLKDENAVHQKTKSKKWIALPGE